MTLVEIKLDLNQRRPILLHYRAKPGIFIVLCFFVFARLMKVSSKLVMSFTNVFINMKSS